VNTTPLQNQYYVYANCNVVHSEDFTFLFTALFYWEMKYPTLHDRLIVDPDILIREKQPELDLP
jgi:hypothetical protein